MTFENKDIEERVFQRHNKIVNSSSDNSDGNRNRSSCTDRCICEWYECCDCCECCGGCECCEGCDSCSACS